MPHLELILHIGPCVLCTYSTGVVYLWSNPCIATLLTFTCTSSLPITVMHLCTGRQINVLIYDDESQRLLREIWNDHAKKSMRVMQTIHTYTIMLYAE